MKPPRPLDIINACGGRKFVMSMGCGVACTVLVWHAKIPPETFRDIIIATVGVYIAGNVYRAVKGSPDAPE